MRKLSFEEVQSLRPGLHDIQHSKRHPIVVILDNIRSLHNVGSIFRTADAAFVKHLYLCGITGTPPRDEIRKTSLGAEESVTWSYVKNAEDAVRECRNNNYQIVALEHTDQSYDYQSAPYEFPVCLIVGHEYNGIDPALIDMCDIAVEIPMHGIKQSLNVSVAFGVAVYQLLQQREQT